VSERRFEPLSLEAMSPEQRRIADAILAGPRGTLQGPFNALLRSPGLAEPAQELGAHVRFRSSIPPALNELAILVTARKWTAQFEWHAHRRLALAAGLDPAIVDEIAAGRRPASLDREQAIVFEFMTELLETGGVSDGAYAAVVGAFGEQGVVDLIGAAGYYSLVAFLLNVERYPVPDGPDPLQPL
jgi:4-carboxymuconolactone decarboxylase